MGHPFLDYMREGELGRGTIAGTTLPELKPPKLDFSKPLARPVGETPETQHPFLAHLKGDIPEPDTTPVISPKPIYPVAQRPAMPPQEFPERGWIGDIVRAIPRGFLGLGEMGARAARTLSPFGGETTTGIIEATKGALESEALRPSAEAAGGSFGRTAVTGGVESIIPSIGAGLPAMAAGAAIGSVVPGVGTGLGALGGWLTFALGAGTTFGLAEYDRFMEEARGAGVEEGKARPLAVISGLVEGGVEAGANLLGAKLLGLTGKSLSQPIKNTIRQMLKVPLRETLRGTMKQMPVEISTEMIQGATEQFLRQKAGIPVDQTPWEVAKDAVGPTMVMTILFGLGAKTLKGVQRRQTEIGLENPGVPIEARQRAVQNIFEGLKNEAVRMEKTDPESAKDLAGMALQWRQDAGMSLERGEPITLDQSVKDYLNQQERGRRERVPMAIGPEREVLEPMAWPEEEPQKLLTTQLPPGVVFGEDFIMAEPWIVRRGTETLELPGPEAMKLLPGPGKPIPQLPFIPPPAGTTLGDGFMMKEPVQPKVYAKVAEDAYKEVIRMGADGRPILGDKTYKRSQIVPKEATVKTGKGKITPGAGVTSAGVLPTERPSAPKPGELVRETLRSGNVEGLKARVIYRPVGSTEGLIEINGQRFVIDDTDRLKMAGVNTSYMGRKSTFPGKTQGEVNAYMKQFPKLGKEDFAKPPVTPEKGATFPLQPITEELPGIGKPIPPTVTPAPAEKPPIAPKMPASEAQMTRIRDQGAELGFLSIGQIKRVTGFGDKKANEVLNHFISTGEVEFQEDRAEGVPPYKFVGKPAETRVAEPPTEKRPFESTKQKGIRELNEVIDKRFPDRADVSEEPWVLRQIAEMWGEVQGGVAGRRIAIEDKTVGQGTNLVWMGEPSTFPEWFKNQGWGKEKVLMAIDKFIRGEKLGALEERIADAVSVEAKKRYEEYGVEEAEFLAREKERKQILEKDPDFLKDETFDDLTKGLDNEIISIDERLASLREELNVKGATPQEILEAVNKEREARGVKEEPTNLQEIKEALTEPTPEPAKELVALPEIQQIQKEMGITEPGLPLEERVAKLERAGFPEGAEKLRGKKPAPSPTRKGEQLLPGMKVGLEFPSEGKEVTPTLEGTPLAEAARRAEQDRVQPKLFGEKVEPAPEPAAELKLKPPITTKGFTGKVSELSREEFIERETSRWKTTAEEEGKRYDEIMAEEEKELPEEMNTIGVFMNPSPKQIEKFIADSPSKSEAIPVIKVDDLIVAGSKTTHALLLTQEEIQAFIDQGKKIELGFIDKKTGEYYTKKPKEMLGEKGFTGERTSEDIGFFVDELRIKFQDLPDIEVVSTFQDLPNRSGVNPNAAGVFDPLTGKVYFVSDRIKNAAHAKEVFFHDVMGHWGLPKMMGRDYNDLIENIIKDFRPDIDRIAKKYELDTSDPRQLWRAAEEKIGEVAQKGDNPNLLRRVIYAVKQWIAEKFGVDFKVSDNDIRNLIRKTSEAMKKGEISRASDAVNFKIETLRGLVGHQQGRKPKAGEMGLHWQDSPYFMLADNPMNGGGGVWESIKSFRNKYTLGIKGSDLNWSERLYMLPWHIGQKFPNFRKLIDVQLNRDESREQMNHEMVQKAFAESVSETHEFLALPKDQSQSLFKVMVWSDDANKFFGSFDAKNNMVRDVAGLQTKAKEVLGKELSPDQVTAYYAWKKTMDSAWARVKRQHETMTFAPYEDQSWYEDLKKGYSEFSKLKRRGLKFKNYILEEMSPGLFRPGGKYTDAQLKDLGHAADRLEKPISRLKELRDDMGRWTYYVPRIREKGDYVIRGYDKGNKIIVSVRAVDQIRGARARDRFMKEYPDLRWEAKFEPQPIEEMYQKVSDIHLEQFIKKGIDRAKKKEKITAEEADHITDSLFEAVADDLKARGFASHFIMREEGAAVKGYEAENGQKVFYDYMTGLSGFLTKQRAAFDFFKSLEGIDPSKQPELFKEGSSYVEDMLRNSDRLDKLSGKVRAAAFTYYLSGSIKAAMVQFTQNFVTGVPHLGRVTKNPLKKYVQSMKDIASWKMKPEHLSKEEQDFLHEMHEKGIDTAQYLREVRGRMKNQFGGTLDQISQVLATPFSGMEVFNRESASLAMFRVMRNEKGASYKEAFDAARDYVYNTHYLYGKSNLPAWARTGTPGSRVARTAYTFRSFNHNFLLSMIQSLKGPDGKIALDVMGRTMAYLVIFGGVTSIPFLDDLLDGMERMTGTPYKSNMRKVLKGIGGDILAKFGMEGLPAILGADLTGSLKIGIPTVSASDVYGVYGGMWDKGKKAMDSFQRADIYRGVESLMPVFLEAPMKAYRMATEGATTPTGKVMFDEEGKPVKLTPQETAAQVLAFRPERISVLGKEKRSLANVEKHYGDQRDDLYSKLRMAKGNERADVLRQIRAYNLEVQKYKGVITSISQEMIRNALRQRPDKKFIRFEGR